MVPLPENFIIYIPIAISLVLLIFVLRLSYRVTKLTRGKSGGSLEDSIESLEQNFKNILQFQKETAGFMDMMEKKMSGSIRGVHTVTYNAFKGLDSGGNHSFATALIDESGNGIILSTLHARDRVNVFSKKITNFKPQNPLSEEEQEALTKACESCRL